MNAHAQKIDLIHWITELTDDSILNQVVSFKDLCATREYAATEAEAASIERGLLDIEHGRVYSHVTAKQRYEKWLHN